MAVMFEKIVKDTVDTIKKASKPKTSGYDVNGIVKRVDGKTAWVHFDGGVDETPVRMTINARKGDKVRVHVGGGKAYITGNETAPPTDDGEARKATKYAGEAKRTADDAGEKADKAQKSADEAMNATESLAEDVSTLSDDVDGIESMIGDGDDSGIEVKTQYYLSTSNASLVGGQWVDSLPTYVSGRYYWTRTVTIYADGSEVEGTPTLDVTNQIAAEVNALATATDQHFWHDSTGAYVTRSNKDVSNDYAMKFTNQGILQTYNGKNLMALTGSGLSLYQSDGSTLMAAYTSSGAYMYAGGSVAASFTGSGATIYSGSTVAALFSSSGVDLYSGTTRAASFTSTGVTLYSGGSTRFIMGNLAAVFNVLTYFDQQPSFKSSALPFSVSSHSFTIPAISTSGGSTGAQTATFSKSTYYPIAIAGFQTGGSNLVFARLDLTSSSLSSATITYNARAIGTTTSASSASVRILWVKSHSVSPTP